MTMMTAATANNPRFAERMHKSLLSLTEPYQIKRQMAYMSDEDLAAMPEEVARSWQRILQGESQPQQTGQIPQQTGQIPISQAAPAATPTSAARSSGLEDGLYRFDPEVGLDNVSRFGHNVWEGVKGTAEGAYVSNPTAKKDNLSQKINDFYQNVESQYEQLINENLAGGALIFNGVKNV